MTLHFLAPLLSVLTNWHPTLAFLVPLLAHTVSGPTEPRAPDMLTLSLILIEP